MGTGEQILADDSSLIAFVAVVRDHLQLGLCGKVICKGSYFLFFIRFVVDFMLIKVLTVKCILSTFMCSICRVPWSFSFFLFPFFFFLLISRKLLSTLPNHPHPLIKRSFS